MYCKRIWEVDSRRGVSLVELLVVIVLVAIMASISVPSLGTAISKRRLDNEIDFIAGTLLTSRTKAIEKGFPFRLDFDASNKNFISFGDKNSNGMKDDGEEVLGPYLLKSGISFGSGTPTGPNNTQVPEDGISLVDNRLTFNRTGSSNAGTIYLKKTQRTAAIRIMPASGAVVCWIYDGKWRKK
jgi:prepilin-type N-terminal cleavage/methylation domain-containing protein